jgi:hypothetical protein
MPIHHVYVSSLQIESEKLEKAMKSTSFDLPNLLDSKYLLFANKFSKTYILQYTS